MIGQGTKGVYQLERFLQNEPNFTSNINESTDW
jgi:hypothetical protein